MPGGLGACMLCVAGTTKARMKGRRSEEPSYFCGLGCKAKFELNPAICEQIIERLLRLL